MSKKEIIYKGYKIGSSPRKLRDPPGTFSPHGFITYITGEDINVIKLHLMKYPMTIGFAIVKTKLMNFLFRVQKILLIRDNLASY